MQHSILHNITRILLGALIGGAVMVGVVYAINTTLDGWATTGAQQNITDYTGTCKKITGPAGYFIPSRTAAEWNAFAAVAASKGIAINSCSYTVSGIATNSSPYTLTCNAGGTIVSAVGGCQYPGYYGADYIGSYVVTNPTAGNGWVVDCRVSTAIWPAGCEDFTWGYGDPPNDQCWYGYAREGYAGAATLTITCQ